MLSGLASRVVRRRIPFSAGLVSRSPPTRKLYQLGGTERLLKRSNSGEFRTSETEIVDRRGEYFYNFGNDLTEFVAPPPSLGLDTVSLGDDSSDLMFL